jgi:membrane protein YdbS with pleckstrin-like domain
MVIMLIAIFIFAFLFRFVRLWVSSKWVLCGLLFSWVLFYLYIIGVGIWKHRIYKSLGKRQKRKKKKGIVVREREHIQYNNTYIYVW